MSNHLGQRHMLVNASWLRVSAGGHEVYGMLFFPGYGYHQDTTRGIAVGNDPESLFAVMSGTHYNDKCCFGACGGCMRATVSPRGFLAGASHVCACAPPTRLW